MLGASLRVDKVILSILLLKEIGRNPAEPVTSESSAWCVGDNHADERELQTVKTLRKMMFLKPEKRMNSRQR